MIKSLMLLCVLVHINLIFAADDVAPLTLLNQKCGMGQKKCVQSYLCENGTIITDGHGIFLPRFGDVDHHFHDECNHYQLRCCSLNEISPQLEINTVVHPSCGYRNTEGALLKLKSKTNESEFGEFSWTLAVFSRSSYLCGASLITERVAITAAHNIEDKSIESLKVRAGEWDTRSSLEPLKYDEYKVQEVIIHENFYIGTAQNDIALLILKEPVILNAHINTICLPPQDYSYDGRRGCIVTGWGKDKFGKDGVYQNILKKIEPPIVPSNECQEKLRKTRLGDEFKLHESFLCAGDEQNDSCQGDGGSALFCPIEGNPGYYYQIGIVSWGIGCKSSAPGVYVNVAKFRSWIDQKIQNRNLPTTRYEKTITSVRQSRRRQN